MNSAWKVFFAFLVSFSALNAQTSPLQIVQRSGTNEYVFGVLSANLPVATRTDASYTTFFFTGDGNFLMGTLKDDFSDAFSTKMFTYGYKSIPSNLRPHIETTLVYDDKKEPPHYARNSGPENRTAPYPISMGSSVPVEGVVMESKAIRVQSARKIVSDHAITFIITVENILGCENPGALVDFYYDSDALAFNGLADYPSSGIAQISSGPPPILPGTDVIHLRMTGAWGPNQQRNIFLTFTTRHFELKTPQELKIIPQAKIEFTPGSLPCTDTLSESQRVDELETITHIELAHDPNRKMFTPDEIDLDYRGNLVVDVNFQNDGYGPANTITITDPFDMYFWRDGCPVLEGRTLQEKIALLKLSCEPGQIQDISFSGGKLVVKITDAYLRGLREYGYGHLFTEEETMGHLQFTIPATDKCVQSQYRYRCSAIADRAGIVFDNNPPVYTNTALLRFRCYAGSKGSVACNTCTEDTIVVAPIVQGGKGAPLIPGRSIPGFNSQQYSKFKWYPEEGLSAWNIYNPVLNHPIVENYTLVAATNNPDDCRRVIVQVPVRSPCKIKLSVTTAIQHDTDCPSDAARSFDLTAKVLETTSSTLVQGTEKTNLKWQNGEQGVNQILLQNQRDTAITIAVYNTVTNCRLEQRVRLKPDPIVIDENPLNCTGDPIVLGATQPYRTTLWEWFEAGVAHSSTTPPLSLSGKYSTKVKIIDANGCVGTLENIQCRF